MNGYIQLPSLLWVVCLAALSGCGATPLRPEAEVAAVGASFQQSAKDFTDARRRIVQNRQRTLNGLEEGALQTREEVETALSIWKVAGNKERVRLYEELVGASQAASERAEKLAAAREELAKTLAQADTKVALDQAKLAEAFNLLSSLGEGLSATERAKFLLAFAKETRAEIEQAAQETKDKAAKNETEGTQP